MPISRRSLLTGVASGAVGGLASTFAFHHINNSDAENTLSAFHLKPETATEEINDWLSRPSPTGEKHLYGSHSPTEPISIPSDTHLYLTGCTLTRNHGSGGNGGATIVNSNQSGGNRNISIVGGIFRSDKSAKGKHFGIVGVTQFRLTSNTIESAVGDFMAVIKNCHQVNIEGLQWSGSSHHGEDGLHLYGGSDYVISNCNISSGDDAIAITVEAPDNEDLQHIQVSNCNLSSRMASGIKIHTRPKARSAAVRHVNISNISITQPVLESGHDAVRIIDDSKTDEGIYNVTLSNIVIDNNHGPGTGIRSAGADQLTLDNVTIWNTNGQPVWITGKERNYSDLAIRNVRTINQSGPGRSAIHVENADGFNIADCMIREPLGHGILAVESTNGYIAGNLISGSPQSGIRVEACEYIQVIGNRIANSEVAISQVGSSTNNTFTANDPGDSVIKGLAG